MHYRGYCQKIQHLSELNVDKKKMLTAAQTTERQRRLSYVQQQEKSQIDTSGHFVHKCVYRYENNV